MSAEPTSPDPVPRLRGGIIVPVPEAEPLVGAWRARHDPSAPRGVPAHVTLLFPFLAASELDADGLAFLTELFATTPAVHAELVAVSQFPSVVYLAPEPADWFVRLTHAISARFGLLPYGGAYPTVIPHLTIAQDAEPAAMAEIARQAADGLPIAFTVREVWLMEQRDEGYWRREATFRVDRSQ
jgi:2'-5' RNA ligase